MRWTLFAAAGGAVLAALVTLLISGFHGTGLRAHGPGGPAAQRAFSTVAKGDCLTWTAPDHSDLQDVDCGQRHLFEVTETIDLSDYPGSEFGPQAPWPDSLRLGELRDQHCGLAAQQYLGGKFDPHGRYSVGLMYPSTEGWTQSGDRTLRCGLQVSGSGGNPLPVTGRAADGEQTKLQDPGTCLGIDQNLPTDPVDCGQPHSVEMTGIVDEGTKFTGGPPSAADQDSFLQNECGRLSNDYLGGPEGLRNKTLTVFFDHIDARSWLAGNHKLNCMVGKGDQNGFATIVGSAKGDITINGQKPVPPPKTGRSTPAPLPGAAPPR